MRGSAFKHTHTSFLKVEVIGLTGMKCRLGVLKKMESACRRGGTGHVSLV